MELARLICPECNAVIKPSKPVSAGKKIKCPKCGSTFEASETKTAPPRTKTAAAGAAPAAKKQPAALVPEKKPEPAPAKRPDDDEDDGPATYGFLAAEEPVKPAPQPAKKKPKRPKDEDDELEDDEEEMDETEEEEEEKEDVVQMYLKTTESTDPRGRATEILSGPSNKAILTYGFLTLAQLVAFIYWIFPFLFAEHLYSPRELRDSGQVNSYGKPFFTDVHGKPIEPLPTWEQLQEEARGASGGSSVDALAALRRGERTAMQVHVVMAIFPLVLFFYCGVVVLGAVKMQNLESWKWAWFAVILGLIPVATVGAAWAALAWIADLVGPIDPWSNDVSHISRWREAFLFAQRYALFWLMSAGLALWCLVISLDSMKALKRKVVKEAFFYVEE